MRKPGKASGEKVWAQLTNLVTNSLTKLDFHVNIDVDVDVGHVHLHVSHHVQLHVGPLFLLFFVGHHVRHRR